MSTDERRERVRDAVRRLLGVEPLDNAGQWSMTGHHRGVALGFSYFDEMTVRAQYPHDYPIYMHLRNGSDSSCPPERAPFFVFACGKAAPMDIAMRLLDETVCTDLRRLTHFELAMHELYSGSSTTEIRVSTPGWNGTPEMAHRMLDIVASIMLRLDEARAAADAAAGVSAGAPYRGAIPDLERIHEQRLAEIEAERSR
jgi:hypothetical protein